VDLPASRDNQGFIRKNGGAAQEPNQAGNNGVGDFGFRSDNGMARVIMNSQWLIGWGLFGKQAFVKLHPHPHKILKTMRDITGGAEFAYNLAVFVDPLLLKQKNIF